MVYRKSQYLNQLFHIWGPKMRKMRKNSNKQKKNVKYDYCDVLKSNFTGSLKLTIYTMIENHTRVKEIRNNMIMEIKI